jgi:hypothetical protein
LPWLTPNRRGRDSAWPYRRQSPKSSECATVPLLWRTVGPVPASTVAALVAARHLANPAATVLAGATVAVAGTMFCSLYALVGRLWGELARVDSPSKYGENRTVSQA